ncbi:MAG: hypothetical protein E6R03_17880 [Hyphomicrobiaceae bacterium]|nr:MAG: hypothetical protein E6R03_17880 [Hyphomicrobiaceae bacterium]
MTDDTAGRLTAFAGITPSHPSGGSFLNPVAKALVNEAAARINSDSDTIASLRREREEARQIVRDIYWMALRYADGRKSYAVGMCNDAVQKAYDGGWITPKDQGGDPITPRLARDGMAAEWLDISARAHAAEAQVANLTEQVRQAFLDGVTYASNVEVTDLELAWEQSRARAALQKDKT